MVRLVTGCSWTTAERLLGGVVSDTTPRERRDEWIAAGVFDAVAQEALGTYDRIVGLDRAEVAVDGSAHKAPGGGEGTDRNPTDWTNPAGSGLCSVTGWASRCAGPPTAPTAATSHCASRHSPPPNAACSRTSTLCT